jgi:hypothetical protein
MVKRQICDGLSWYGRCESYLLEGYLTSASPR